MARDLGVLRAALLWARNHIDGGVKPHLKEVVVQRLDEVLADHRPTSEDVKMLRDYYPVDRVLRSRTLPPKVEPKV